VATGKCRQIVIGIGNPSRGDDAVAHHVLEALPARLHGAARPALVKTHQLDMTLAPTLASHDLVIFVDALLSGRDDELVRLRSVRPCSGFASPSPSHTLTPAELLAVTRWLYGNVPKALLVTVAGRDFSFGECLSPLARRAVPLAVDLIVSLLAESNAPPVN